MEVRYFVLSEYFGVEDNGKFTFAGVFDQVTATGFPTALGTGILTLVLNATVGERSEDHRLEIKLRSEGNSEFVATIDVPIPTTDDGLGHGAELGEPTNLFVRVVANGVGIPSAGTYYFDSYFDGERTHSVRLRAIQAPIGEQDE